MLLLEVSNPKSSASRLSAYVRHNITNNNTTQVPYSMVHTYLEVDLIWVKLLSPMPLSLMIGKDELCKSCNINSNAQLELIL